jgi:two-component system, NtrC family, response regulator AtoC
MGPKEMIAPYVLVVSSELTTLHALGVLLARSSYRAESAIDADALGIVQRIPTLKLVLLEIADEDGTSLGTLQRLRSIRPDLIFVVLSAYGDSRQVVEAIHLGAQDYLNVPLDEAQLQRVLQHYLGPDLSEMSLSSTCGTVEELGEGEFFVAANPAMRKIRVQAELLANIDVPVLIEGEVGTGKRSVAQLIHRLSRRAHRPFLSVNCGALSEELLESELFGYEWRVFTGARRTRQGKLEQCDEGTILLDNVDQISASLQTKLLQLLLRKQFFRLGGEVARAADVRILAATNLNLAQVMANPQWKGGLFYRMTPFTIVLPPLRERKEDIPLLLHHFMNRVAARFSRQVLALGPSLINACLHYPWPGNVMELENFAKEYLMVGDESLALRELESKMASLRAPGRAQTQKRLSASETICISQTSTWMEDVAEIDEFAEGTSGLKSLLQNVKVETERNAISTALGKTCWNRKAAARLLKISYRTLLYKIEHYHMSPHREGAFSLLDSNP